MKTEILIKLILSLCLFKDADTTPGSAPRVAVTGDTTINVSFDAVINADSYIVNLSQRHGMVKIEKTTNKTSIIIDNLNGSTIYDVSVTAKNETGDILIEGSSTPAQTHPSPPTIHTNTLPLPNVVLIFFDTPNKARVSQWTVEYRVFGSSVTNTATTETGKYYALGLSNLLANTLYEVRARASQINSSTYLTESDSGFSEWQNVTTGLLELFGRADLVKVNYTAEHSEKNSTEQNLILANLQHAYMNKANGGIKLLEVKKSPNLTGKARVYFEIKILDTQLPTVTNFSLLATDYKNVFINNEIPNAETFGPLVYYGLREFSFEYEAESENAKVVMGATLTCDDEGTVMLPLMATHPSEADDTTYFESQIIILDSKQPVDSDRTLYHVTANKVVGMTPEFLVRDEEDIYKMYRNNILFNLDPEARASSLFFTTRLDSSILNLKDVTYESSSSGSEVTIILPAVDRAIRYEIVNGSKAVTILEESDIDGSDKVKINVPSLKSGTKYTFNISVTTRRHDGSDDTWLDGPITVTPTLDECNQDTLNNCHPNATCIETIESFECSCNSGYSGNGTHCQDIDECNNVTLHGCHANATCINSDGSYTCTCNPGYSGNGTDCSDVDECKNITINNCHANATCNNTDGSYICTCNSGYSGNGTDCSDVDECKNITINNCHANATCNNTDGSYICTCNSGYSGNGTSCSDIDECKNITINNCHANATCNNTDGSYICTCNSGYSGNGFFCKDIDECTNNSLHDCNYSAKCINSPGSFSCLCNLGFVGNGTFCQLQCSVAVFGTSLQLNCENITNVDELLLTANMTPAEDIISHAACEDIAEDEKYFEIVVTDTVTFIQNLVPGTTYNIVLKYIVNGNSTSIFNDTYTIESYATPSPTFSVEKDSIFASWHKPYGGTEYLIDFTCIDNDHDDTRMETTTDPMITFDSLLPGRRYNVCITLLLCEARAVGSVPNCNDTYTLPARPSIILITHTKNITSLKWEVTRGTMYTRIVLKAFSATGRRKRDTPTVDVKNNFWEGTVNGSSVDIRGLDAGQEFDLDVIPGNSAGEGESSSTTFLVPTNVNETNVPPNPVTDISVITFTDVPTTTVTDVPTTAVTGVPTTKITNVPTTEVTHESTTGFTDVPTTEVTHVSTTEVTKVPTTQVTHVPTTEVTNVPTTEVTHVPTTEVTHVPTTEVTNVPSTKVTHVPTTEVTNVPTTEVTNVPTTAFTDVPTTAVTNAPTTEATNVPTTAFTDVPTTGVTNISTTEVTHAPTTEVTNVPTTEVTHVSTTEVTYVPTTEVNYVPTTEVTRVPTTEVTNVPTTEVTYVPTTEVTYVPTTEVTNVPTTEVTNVPTSAFTDVPTTAFTDVPTTEVTNVPTTEVTNVPTTAFTDVPTTEVTNVPTTAFTDVPTTAITNVPTTAFTDVPTTAFNNVPTTEVTNVPTTEVTNVPTTAFTDVPTTEVTNVPTTAFTDVPTTAVTNAPTTEVTNVPTTAFTDVPTTGVTNIPTTEVTHASTTEVTHASTTEVTNVPTTEVTHVSTTEVTYVPTTEVTYVSTTEVTRVPTTEVTNVPTTEVTYVPTTEVTYVPTTEVIYVPECVFDSSQEEDFNPTFLNITESSISVVWQDIPNVETYTISVHCVNCGNDTRSVGTSSTNVANFISLQPGSTYEVCLTVDLCNAGILNPTTRCSETTLVPPAITNVNKTVAALFVVLNWESVPGAKHYVVSFVILNTGKRRKRSAGVLTAWSDPVSSTTYKTSNIISGTTYKYSVAATNDAGTGISFEDDFTTEIPTTPKNIITHQPIELSTPEPTRKIIFQSVTTRSKITVDKSSATIKSTPDMRLNTTTKKDSSLPSVPPNTSDNPSTLPNKIVTADPQSTALSTKEMTESTREMSTLTDTTRGQSNTITNTTKQTEDIPDITERSSSERGTLTITTDFQPTGTSGIINEGFPRWLIGVIILAIIFIIVSVIAVVIYCRRKQRKGSHVALGI